MLTTGAERQSLVDQFRASEDLFLRQLKDATEAQLDFHSSPECWSIRQIAEHVALVEEMLFSHLPSVLCQTSFLTAAWTKKSTAALPTASARVPHPRGEAVKKPLQFEF